MNATSPISDLAFRIHHTMVPVADLERSIDFYTRLFGMTLMGRRRNEARNTDVAHVGYGDRATQPSLELTQDMSSKAPARIAPTGIHVSIHVDDLRRLCTILEEAGVEFIQPFTERPGGRLATAWVRDPDGNELELGSPRPGH